LCGLALRIALTLHALATWALAGKPGDAPKINADTMRAAIRWADYLAAAERYSREGLADDGEGVAARRLIELVQRKGGHISGRELVQASRLYPKVADAEAALGELAESGAGSWVTPAQRGPGQPKARRFTLAPVYAVNTYRTPAGGTEKADIVDVDTVDTPPNPNTVDDWGTA